MRIAVSSSFGCTDVRCVMSTFGPMKNSSAPTTRSPLVLRMTNFASSATSAGAVSDGLTAMQRSAVEQRMLAVHAFRRVGEAGVAAGAVAGQAIAVVDAARILRDVAAHRAGVADLRAGHAARRIGQHAVVRTDGRAALDLGQRGQRADLDAVRRLANALQLGDAGDIDHRLRALGALLEPAQAVVAARELPAVRAMAVQQCEGVRELRRLVQLEAQASCP